MQRAVLSVCISCILAGCVKGFLPQKYHSRVINQLCVLYILLSSFSAVQKIPWHQVYSFLNNNAPYAQPLDFSYQLSDLFLDQIAADAQEVLDSEGLAAVSACRFGPDGTLLLELTARDPQTLLAVETLFEEKWQGDVPYIVLEKEGAL